MKYPFFRLYSSVLFPTKDDLFPKRTIQLINVALRILRVIAPTSIS